jgi:prepilin-type N-terminal cleavage/methylation domain-containing protein
MRAFTLIETIAVLALIAILASVGSIISARYLADQQLRASADTVFAEIQAAQGAAYTQAEDASYGVKAFADRVVRFQGGSYAARDPARDVETRFPGEVALSGDDEVVFPPASLAPSSAATVTLQNERIAIDIFIDAYGPISSAERSL